MAADLRAGGFLADFLTVASLESVLPIVNYWLPLVLPAALVAAAVWANPRRSRRRWICLAAVLLAGCRAAWAINTLRLQVDPATWLPRAEVWRFTPYRWRFYGGVVAEGLLCAAAAWAGWRAARRGRRASAVAGAGLLLAGLLAVRVSLYTPYVVWWDGPTLAYLGRPYWPAAALGDFLVAAAVPLALLLVGRRG